MLRQYNLNVFTSLNAVVQQLEPELGLDLSHKDYFDGFEQNRSEFEKVTCSRSITTKSSKALGYRPDFLSIRYDIDAMVPITCFIKVCLFALQHYGTHRIGFCFAPIFFTWLLWISALGLYNIFHWNPHVYQAYPHIT